MATGKRSKRKAPEVPSAGPASTSGLVLAGAVAAHAAYSIAVAAVVLAARLDRAAGASGDRGKADALKAAAGAAFATEALVGGLRTSLPWLAPVLERATGAAASPGVRGHLLLFGAIASLLAAARVLPAAIAGAVPSSIRLDELSAGGLLRTAAIEAAGAVGKALGLALFCLAAEEVARRGPRGGLALAGALAFAFVAAELAGFGLALWAERDLLEYEPGEAVRPLDRADLVKRVREIADGMGVPEAASRVMVDDTDDSLNAFAMRRVVVLSARTAALEDVEHAAGIVAHELAHVKLRHVRKTTAMYSGVSAGRFLMLFAALALPGMMAAGAAGAGPGQGSWVQRALPLSTAARSAALLYVLARPLVDEVGRAAALALSRADELASDRLGAAAVGRAKYVEMLRKLGEDGYSMGPPYEALLAHRMTHPPIEARIAAVNRST